MRRCPRLNCHSTMCCCSSEICLCEKLTQRLADSSVEFYRRCERRESCQGHQKCRFKLICARSRTVTSTDSLFMDGLVFSVSVMTLILYLTAWPHHYPASSLCFVVKDWNKKTCHKWGTSISHGKLSEFSGFSEHFWCDSIGNLAGIKAVNFGASSC